MPTALLAAVLLASELTRHTAALKLGFAFGGAPSAPSAAALGHVTRRGALAAGAGVLALGGSGSPALAVEGTLCTNGDRGERDGLRRVHAS